MQMMTKWIAVAVALSSGLQAEFFFSRETIDKNLETFTDEEVRLLKKDLGVVRSICLEDTQNTETRFYLATAGGPGSRKTTILERFIASHPEVQGGVYLDSDTRTLKYMGHAYYARSLTPLKISESPDYLQVVKAAYDKWRWGADYITQTLMEEAIGLRRSVIFGTTSTKPYIAEYFARLKECGYQIILLLCSAPDEFRRKVVEYRNQIIRFYQSAPDDAVAKGKLFPQRMGAYFAYADRIYFYWSDELFLPERLAGIWEKGKMTLTDPEAMQLFIDKYEEDRAALALEGQSIPSFKAICSLGTE